MPFRTHPIHPPTTFLVLLWTIHWCNKSFFFFFIKMQHSKNFAQCPLFLNFKIILCFIRLWKYTGLWNRFLVDFKTQTFISYYLNAMLLCVLIEVTLKVFSFKRIFQVKYNLISIKLGHILSNYCRRLISSPLSACKITCTVTHLQCKSMGWFVLQVYQQHYNITHIVFNLKPFNHFFL